MILVVQTSLATLASLPVTPPGRCGIHAPWMHPTRTTWLDSEPALRRIKPPRKHARLPRARSCQKPPISCAKASERRGSAPFGSLVTTGLAPGSDIDLYVDAVTRGRYWQAVAQLARLFGRPVDLVELAHAPSELLATIAEDGVDVP